MKIRIIKTPTGQAPEKVRQFWVGCLLEVHGLNKDGVLSIRGKPGINENSFGYIVTKEECMRELRRKGRHLAARFWEMIDANAIVFGKQFCEVYDDY